MLRCRGRAGGLLREVCHEGRALHSLLHRRLFSGSGHRDSGTARTARLLGRVSARSDLLRPADGQQRLPGRLPPPPRPTSSTASRISTRSSGRPASCVHHVRFHLDAIEQTPEARKVRAGTRELVEFLHDDLKVARLPLGRRFRTRWACTTVAPPSGGSATRGRRSGSTSRTSRRPGTCSARSRGSNWSRSTGPTSAAASAAASA